MGVQQADSVLDKLKSTFGYSVFRPLQEEIVRSILEGEDVFVLMPTGGGKSLCYQLPALLREGTTVVVSPLIALMKDQVDALTALGVAATYINSALDPEEISRREMAVARGQMDLVYVAPERLMTPGFMRILKQVRLGFFAIDEAHCISEWGHDFRPEYRDLRQLRVAFPEVPFGSFTATATARVQVDIKRQLGLEWAPSFRGSFDRPNLFYEVRPKKDAYQQLVGYLRTRPGASGIIYCSSRAGSDDLAAKLRGDGFRAASYHAGLNGEDRRQRQDAFIRDDTPIIVATIAFGMGIDKPDVRFVIHYDLPKTLENYYQESGRAGRDGEPSDCILFYSYGDVMKYQRFIDEKTTEEERQTARRQLQQMADWADRSTCRRQALLAYFDEPYEPNRDSCCDICRTPPDRGDFTVEAQMFLSCVKRTGERFGATYVIQVLRGSRDQRILNFRHDGLSTYGIGKDRSEEEWRHLSRELIRGGYLLQDEGSYNALKVTARGRAVLFQGEKAFLVAPRKAAQANVAASSPFNPDLFERLRALRKRLADERGVAPYMVFPDTTLKHMAAALPGDERQLLGISGVGQQKASAFGDDFLQTIADFVEETGAVPVEIPGAVAPRSKTRTKREMGSTVRTTLDMARAGLDVATIASARGLAQTTIERHLADAVEAGELTDIDMLVAPVRRQTIEDAFAQVGLDFLGPVMEFLGPGFSYGELHVVRAAIRRAVQADR